MEKLDILNREEFVNKLVNLTKNISANRTSTSFAINGVWGCGKSFVLDMYEERLKAIQSEETATDKYFVIRYNCWKYDYYEEPLIAIVAAIIDIIEKKTELFPNSKEKHEVLGMLKATGVALLSMANAALKEKTGIDFQSAYDIVNKGKNEGAEAFENEHKYDVYFGFNKVIEKLSSILEELASMYTVVLLVDELDRCLPEYAIKVLERLHHLTEGTINIITVITYDKMQLEHSIKSLFGFDDCSAYLKKFVQFELKLEYGKISERFVEKHADYIDLFDKTIVEYEDSIEEFMQAVFQKIEAREQEQIINRTMLVHKLLYNDLKDYSFMCIELLSVVLFTCYKDMKKFSDWFDKFYRLQESSKEWPPFDYYFNTKFSGVPYKKIVRGGTISGEFHQITHEKSLYGAIAYIWYSLYMKDKNGFKMEVENVEFRKLLDKNVEELKLFIDNIRLIK